MPPAPDTLDRLPRGAVARVVDVIGRLDGDPIARRLDDLGLREGVRVEVIRRAPLGDPTVFELHGYQLCLRRSESARVQISVAPRSPDGSPDVDPDAAGPKETTA